MRNGRRLTLSVSGENKREEIPMSCRGYNYADHSLQQIFIATHPHPSVYKLSSTHALHNEAFRTQGQAPISSHHHNLFFGLHALWGEFSRNFDE